MAMTLCCNNAASRLLCQVLEPKDYWDSEHRSVWQGLSRVSLYLYVGLLANERIDEQNKKTFVRPKI